MAGSGEARKTGAEQRPHPSGRTAEGWTSVCCITALPIGGHFIHSFGTLDRCQEAGATTGKTTDKPCPQVAALHGERGGRLISPSCAPNVMSKAPLEKMKGDLPPQMSPN